MTRVACFIYTYCKPINRQQAIEQKVAPIYNVARKNARVKKAYIQSARLIAS
jgi:hypothetical protein